MQEGLVKTAGMAVDIISKGFLQNPYLKHDAQELCAD